MWPMGLLFEFAGGQLSANVCVLADKGVRRKWEEDFSKTYLSPVLKVAESPRLVTLSQDNQIQQTTLGFI